MSHVSSFHHCGYIRFVKRNYEDRGRGDGGQSSKETCSGFVHKPLQYMMVERSYSFQGVFPFHFDRDEADFGVPETQPVERTQPLPVHVDEVEEVAQPLIDEENGQLAPRRSGRQRRTNTNLRGFGEIC
jgi:hypothetical protein